MKKCPYCSGAVQDDARVCPLCQMSLVTPPAPMGTPMGNPMAAPPPGMSPGMGYAPGAYPQGGQETSGKAIGSLICGLLGFVILPVILAIPAIVLGHLSLSEIKKSAGRLKGQGMAIAGLVLGYVGIAFIPIILIVAAIAIPNLLRAKMAANEASAIGTVRTYDTALMSYASACPQQGFPDSAENLGPGAGDCTASGLLDSVLAHDIASRSGYRFFYAHGAPDAQGHIVTFTLNADPVSPSTGMRHFYVDETGVIRVNRRAAADKFSPELNGERSNDNF